jgi:hypothetical protein
VGDTAVRITTVNFTKRGDSAFAPPVRRGYKAAWIR